MSSEISAASFHDGSESKTFQEDVPPQEKRVWAVWLLFLILFGAACVRTTQNVPINLVSTSYALFWLFGVLILPTRKPHTATTAYCAFVALCSFAACIAHAIFLSIDFSGSTLVTSIVTDAAHLPKFDSNSSSWWRLICGFESLKMPEKADNLELPLIAPGIMQLVIDIAVLLCAGTLTTLLILSKTTQSSRIQCTTHLHIGMLALPPHTCGSKSAAPFPLVWFVFVPIMILASTWNPSVLSAINFAILLISAISLRCGGFMERSAVTRFLGVVVVYNSIYLTVVYLYMGIPFLVETVPAIAGDSSFGHFWSECNRNRTWSISTMQPGERLPACFWFGFRTRSQTFQSHSLLTSPLSAVGTFSWAISCLASVALVVLSSLLLPLYCSEANPRESEADAAAAVESGEGDLLLGSGGLGDSLIENEHTSTANDNSAEFPMAAFGGLDASPVTSPSPLSDASDANTSPASYHSAVGGIYRSPATMPSPLIDDASHAHDSIDTSHSEDSLDNALHHSDLTEPVRPCCYCCDKVAIPPGVFGPVCWVVALVVVTSTPCFMYLFLLLWALAYASLPLKLVRDHDSKLVSILITLTFICVVIAYVVNIPFLPMPPPSNSTVQVPLSDKDFLILQFLRLTPFTPPGLGVTGLTAIFFFFLLCSAGFSYFHSIEMRRKGSPNPSSPTMDVIINADTLSAAGSATLVDRNRMNSDVSLGSHDAAATKDSCATQSLRMLQKCKDFVLSNTSMVLMVPIYLFSLSIVDLPRSVYIFFCISTTIFPGIRPLGWRILMWYTSVLTLAAYVVCILSGSQLKETQWTELFGLSDYGIRWDSPFFDCVLRQDAPFRTQLILFILVALQKFLYDRQQLAAPLRDLSDEEPPTPIHLKSWAAFVNSWWGWITMFVMYVESTIPPMSLIGLVQLGLVLLLCLVHMGSNLALHTAAWRTVAVLQGVLLLARYITQFPLVWKEVFHLYKLAIDREYCVPLMLPETGAQLALGGVGGLFLMLMGQTIAWIMTIVMLNVVLRGRQNRKAQRSLDKGRQFLEATRLATSVRMPLPLATSPESGTAMDTDASAEADATPEAKTEMETVETEKEEDVDHSCMCIRRFGGHIALFVFDMLQGFSTEILLTVSMLAGLIPSYGLNTTNWTGDIFSFLYLLIPLLYMLLHGKCCDRKNSPYKASDYSRKLRGSFPDPPPILWLSLFSLAAFSIMVNYTYQFQIFAPAYNRSKTSVFYKLPVNSPLSPNLASAYHSELFMEAGTSSRSNEEVSYLSARDPKVYDCAKLNLPSLVPGADASQRFKPATFDHCDDHPADCCSAIGMYDIVRLASTGDTLSGSGYGCVLKKNDKRWSALRSSLCAPDVPHNKLSQAQAIPGRNPFHSHCFDSNSSFVKDDVWNSQKFAAWVGTYRLNMLGQVFVLNSTSGGVGNVTYEDREIFLEMGEQLWLLMLKPLFVLVFVLVIRQAKIQRDKWERIGRFNSKLRNKTTKRDFLSVHPGDMSLPARAWRYCRDYIKAIWYLALERQLAILRIALMMVIVVSAAVHVSAVSLLYMLILGLCIIGDHRTKRFSETPVWYIFLSAFLIVIVIILYLATLGWPALPIKSSDCIEALQLAGCELSGRQACLDCNKTMWKQSPHLRTSCSGHAADDVGTYCDTHGLTAFLYDSSLPTGYARWLELSNTTLSKLFLDCLAILLAKRMQMLASRSVESQYGDDTDPVNCENPSKSQRIIRLWLVHSVQILLVVISMVVCVGSTADMFSGIYLCFAMYWIYNHRSLYVLRNRGFKWLVTINWAFVALFILYQAPFFGDNIDDCTSGTFICDQFTFKPGDSCENLKTPVCRSNTSAPCLPFYKTLGFNKAQGSAKCVDNADCERALGSHNDLLSSLIIMFCLMVQNQIYRSKYFKFVQTHWDNKESDALDVQRRMHHNSVSVHLTRRRKAEYEHEKQRIELRTILEQCKIWENIIQDQDEGNMGRIRRSGSSRDNTPTASIQQRWLRPPLPPPGIPRVHLSNEPGQSTVVTVTWRHHHLYVTQEPPSAMVASEVEPKRPRISRKSSVVSPRESFRPKLNVDSGIIRKFLVYYQRVYPETSKEYTVMDHWKLGTVAAGNAKTATISSLLPTAQYKFAVSACNSYGKGYIGTESVVIEIPEPHMPEGTDDEEDGEWRVATKSGKQLSWTMALMSEAIYRNLEEENSKFTWKQSGKLILTVSKEKYLEDGKGRPATLKLKSKQRQLDVKGYRSMNCCRLGSQHTVLDVSQAFYFERRYQPAASGPESKVEDDTDIYTDSDTDTDTDTDDENPFVEETKTDQTAAAAAVATDEMKTGDTDARDSKDTRKKRRRTGPWYQIDVYLHTEREWTEQTSRFKLEAVASCQSHEMLFRVKRRDAETKTRLRTLAEIGVPVSTLERHKSLQTQTLINPWDEDQPTNIIMQNGTLVKVSGWHRQQIVGATNKTRLYAHACACDNEKQQGMIRAEYLVPLVTRYSFAHRDRAQVDLLLSQLRIMATNPIVKTVAPAEGQLFGWQHKAPEAEHWTAYSPENAQLLDAAYMRHDPVVILNANLPTVWEIDLCAMTHIPDPTPVPPPPPREVRYMSDDGVELARLEKRVDGKEDVLEDLIVDVSVFSVAWVRRWIVREFRYVIDKSLYPDFDKKNLFQLLWCSFVSMSFVWVGIALVANTLYSASILSALPTVVFFAIALPDYPYPRPQLIKLIFGYTCVVILAQFFFQLHVFCENVYVDQNGEVPPAAFASAKDSSRVFWQYSMQPWCPVCNNPKCSVGGRYSATHYLLPEPNGNHSYEPTCTKDGRQLADKHTTAISYTQAVLLTEDSIQQKKMAPPPQLLPIIGIYKTDKNGGSKWALGLDDLVARPDFLQAIVMDLVVIVVLMLHRYRMERKGLWKSLHHKDENPFNDDEIDAERPATPPNPRKKTPQTDISRMYGWLKRSSAYRWVSRRQRELAQSLGIEISEESYHSPITREKKKQKGMFYGIIRYWNRIHMGTGLEGFNPPEEVEPTDEDLESLLNEYSEDHTDAWSDFDEARKLAAHRKYVGWDLFIYSICLQFLLMVYIFLFYNMIVSDDGTLGLSKLIQAGSEFSGEMIIALTITIITMLVDRAIYLKRFVEAKFVLNIIGVVMLHVWAVVYVPLKSKYSLQDNYPCIFMYLLAMVYFTISGLQIRSGYKRIMDRNYLTSRGYGQVRKVMFMIYKIFPLLFEVRTILDWVMAKTSLSLFMWMRIENIYAELYMVKCTVLSGRFRDKGFRHGKQRPWLERIFLGFLFLAVLITVILFPLYIFSNYNPGQTTNLVSRATATASLEVTMGSNQAQSFELWSSEKKQINKLTAAEWLNVKAPLNEHRGHGELAQVVVEQSWFNSSQNVEMNSFAQNVWTISPPNLDALTELVSTKKKDDNKTYAATLKLQLDVTFTRSDYQTASRNLGTGPVNVTQFLRLMEIARDGTFSTVDDAVDVPHINPIAIRLVRGANSVSSVNILGSADLNRGVKINVNNSVVKGDAGRPGYIRTFWLLYGADDVLSGPQSESSVDKGVVFTVISDMSVGKTAQTLLNLIKVTSIQTFYIVVVWGISQVLRNLCTRPMYMVAYQEMPEPEHLLGLCEGIHTLRRDGKIRDEMLLFRRLIRIMRSQELLLLITKTKYD